MSGSAGLHFMSGAITLGHLVVALFFFRFWARTRDRLFFLFGVAFICLSVNQALVALTGIPREEQSWIYLIRLFAFLLIIIAIIQKNLGKDHRA